MNVLRLLQVYLIGETTNTPKHDLRKKETVEFQEELYAFLQRHFILFAYASVIFLILVVLALAFSLCGICAVESGMMRNFLNGGHI